MAADFVVDSNSYASDRLLVQMRTADHPSEALLTNIAQSVRGVARVDAVGDSGWYQVSLSVGESLTSALQEIQNLSSVLTVTPDFRVSLASTPNDPMFTSQWPLTSNALTAGRIDAVTAWSYGTGSSIVVGVIDTGVDYNHPDLAANIWSNAREIPGNGLDDDGNGYRDDHRGWNFVANNNNPMDDNGHGTHVAGTIGAVGNNGIGVSGVAWNVKLMPLKFLDANGSGYLSDAVRAVDYARANGAKIINASFGGGGFSSAMQTALQRFQQAGGVFVAAAGNESANNATRASYPANYALPNVVSVAASTQSNALASFSNYGTNVDIAAPGQNILSTLPNGRYGTLSGTSMAAPHVAGALALLWGQAPSLTATQLINLLMTNTDTFSTGKTASGKLNIGKAAATLKGTIPNAGDTTAPYVESAQWISNAGVIDSVILDFSEEMNLESVASAITVSGPAGAIAIGGVQKLKSDSTKVIVKLGSNNATAGVYRVELASAASDLAGNRLNQDRDGQAGEAQQDRFVNQTTLAPTNSSPVSYSTARSTSLRDATFWKVGVTQIPIDVSDSNTIGSLSVELSIDHTYVSDLRVRLISPTGTAVTLLNRRAGGSDNIRMTLADNADAAVSGARTLTGVFRAEQSLSAFKGQNARGRWILEVTDLATADIGVLNYAKIQVNPASQAVATANPKSQNDAAALSAALWQMIDSLFRRRT